MDHAQCAIDQIAEQFPPELRFLVWRYVDWPEQGPQTVHVFAVVWRYNGQLYRYVCVGDIPVIVIPEYAETSVRLRCDVESVRLAFELNV